MRQNGIRTHGAHSVSGLSKCGKLARLKPLGHLSASLFLFTAGCATTQPAVRVETIEVIKPVPVPCIDRAKVPAEPAMVGKLSGDARKDADTLGAKTIELRDYGRKLAAMILACVKGD